MIDKINLLKQRLRYLYCRGRNIVYYREIDKRPRAQYMHVLRDFRKDILEFYNNFSKDILLDWELIMMKLFLEKILLIIPNKVKTEDCSRVINEIKYKVYVK